MSLEGCSLAPQKMSSRPDSCTWSARLSNACGPVESRPIRHDNCDKVSDLTVLGPPVDRVACLWIGFLRRCVTLCWGVPHLDSVSSLIANRIAFVAAGISCGVLLRIVYRREHRRHSYDRP